MFISENRITAKLNLMGNVTLIATGSVKNSECKKITMGEKVAYRSHVKPADNAPGGVKLQENGSYQRFVVQ